jgi:ubiquinone/menaquinone biosynthesis C-methylase UbiE
VGLEILGKDKNSYSLYGIGEEFLKEGAENYLGDIFRHYFRLLKRWVNLEQAVRSGKPLVEREMRIQRSEADLRAFILGMENLARNEARELWQAIDLQGVNKVLDLGAGPGTYLITLLQMHPEIRGAMLDYPQVIKITREQVEKEKLKDRIDYIEGDMLEIDLAGTYDLILISSIIHSNSEENNMKIIQKCVKCLPQEGRIIVKDFLQEKSGIVPLNSALFSLNMLLGTEAGRTYSWDEVENWFLKNGLNIVQKFRIGRDSGVIVGKKL